MNDEITGVITDIDNMEASISGIEELTVSMEIPAATGGRMGVFEIHLAYEEGWELVDMIYADIVRAYEAGKELRVINDTYGIMAYFVKVHAGAFIFNTIDGAWIIEYFIDQEEISEVRRNITETDPTVPSWAKEPTKPSYTATEVGALPADTPIPSKVSDLENDLGFLTNEVDPTVPQWAKQQNKPSYTAQEVGALPADTAIPSKVSDLENDLHFLTAETDPTVPAWAKAENKPSYSFSEIGSKPSSLSGYGIDDAYTKSEVDGLVSGVLHYKGTKAAVSQLPSSGNTVGDVWHVTADGSEWAWDGSQWQELGTAVDLSGYVQTSRTVNGKALSSDVTLDADDVGALPDDTAIPAKTSDLQNDSGYIDTAIYYGTCASAAADTTKIVACSDFMSADLKAGAAIFVRFNETNTGAVGSLILNVNSTGAKNIKYINNGTLGNLQAAGHLKANTTYLFVYDGTYWVAFFNYNSTYSSLSQADMQTGTATTGRLITAAMLKAAVEYHALVKSVNGQTGDVVLSIPTVPTDVSAFTNDAGYLTLETLPTYNGGVS